MGTCRTLREEELNDGDRLAMETTAPIVHPEKDPDSQAIRPTGEPTSEITDDVLARVARLDPRWQGALLELLKEAEGENIPNVAVKRRGAKPSAAQLVYGGNRL